MNETEEEKLIKKLETDPIYFIEVFLGRELSEKQKVFLEHTKTKKHILNIWSRQSGKSTVTASYIVWRLLYGKGTTVNKEHMNEQIAIVAPIKEQHVLIYDKIATLVNKSDYISSFIVKMNTEKIVMKNGNFCKFMSASPGSQIRGFSATCIIVDESQDITDAKYSGDILPFGATTNALVIESGTPKTKNHFYSAMQSKTVTVVKQMWFECPFLSETYVMGQKDISPEGLWRQEFLCFTPDTYIMSNKPKKIKDHKKGDIVFNNEGKLIRVKGVLKRKVTEELIKITVWGGNHFICTKEHPIYASVRKGFKPKTARELNFIKAEELRELDYIHFPKLKTIKKKRQYKKEELRLFGLWVAEGSVSAKERTLTFSLGSHETEIIEEVTQNLKLCYDLDSTKHVKNKSKSSTQIITHSTELVKKYLDYFGRGAKNKKIPDFIFDLTKEEIFEFLSGYYAGDGHDAKNKFICCSTSKKLIEQINLLLLKFNIYSKIHCLRDKEEKKIIMGREVTVRPKWQLQTYGLSYNRFKTAILKEKTDFKFSKTIEKDNYDLLLIKNIETVNYEGYVYNLETEDNHTYLTEIGSVHNCEFMEEGVLAFPSRLFEPEMSKTGHFTGRNNIADYEIITDYRKFGRDDAIRVSALLEEGAEFRAGLDLGKQKDNTVLAIIRTDVRPIRMEALIPFPLGTKYKKIAEVVGMFNNTYSFTEFNFDYTNEKGFLESLTECGVAAYEDKNKKRSAISFTVKNKNGMVNRANVLLENYDFQLPKMAEKLLSEFLNQQYEVIDSGLKKFYHPSNENDDSLWATLLALKNVVTAVKKDVTKFVNPWEAQDEKVHGVSKKSAKEVNFATSKMRMDNRDFYASADTRRSMRS